MASYGLEAPDDMLDAQELEDTLASLKSDIYEIQKSQSYVDIMDCTDFEFLDYDQTIQNMKYSIEHDNMDFHEWKNYYLDMCYKYQKKLMHTS